MSLRALTVLPTSGVSLVTNVNSVLLDGVDEYINLGGPAVPTAFSFSYWVKAVVATSGRVPFGKWSSSTNERSFICLISASGRMQLLISANGTTATKDYLSSVTCFGASWAHVVVTVDAAAAAGAGDIKIYLNATEDTSVTKTTDTTLGGAVFTSAAAITLGCQITTGGGVPGSFANVYVDQVSYWDKVLSGAEVSELYNSGDPLDPRDHSASADCTNYWPLGEGSDSNTTFEDYVGSSDGTGVNLESGDIQTDIP